MRCFIHKWNGCTCVRCGEVRDDHHNWMGYKCSYCGKKRDVCEIEDQAILADIALNISEDISTRVDALKKIKDQSVHISALKNAANEKSTMDRYLSIRYILDLISDEKMLLDLAETSDQYDLCYELYRHLNIIPKDYSTCYFTDVIPLFKGANKDDFTDYIINGKLGDTVGLVTIRKSDIEILCRNNQTDVLRKIANSRVLKAGSAHWDLVNFAHELAISSCEKTGGHHFNQNHICKACGVAECKITGNHYFGNSCICKACGLEKHNWQFSKSKLIAENHMAYECRIDIYRCAKCGKEKQKSDGPIYKD